MRPFTYIRATDPAQAILQFTQAKAQEPGGSVTQSPIQYLAGGATLLDLMKLCVPSAAL